MGISPISYGLYGVQPTWPIESLRWCGLGSALAGDRFSLDILCLLGIVWCGWSLPFSSMTWSYDGYGFPENIGSVLD